MDRRRAPRSPTAPNPPTHAHTNTGSYIGLAAHCGVTLRPVRLTLPGLGVPAAELAAAFGDKTKFILLNSPHNPTGKVRT